MSAVTALTMAFGAGVAMAVQLGVNVRLGSWTKDAVLAAFVSFFVGTLALAAYAFATRIPLPSLSDAGKLPLWYWSGGVLGAFVVASAVIVGPRIGSATMFTLMVAGQVSMSLILDHFGLFGLPQHSISPLRVAGVVLVVLGVVLIRKF
ncbi:DMT family transporter [Desulfobaculum sp. SPO524]|uniref:DMT family transporter n=1 Tax=Desulfobaculum sp. SPO524 TaxID=3378071 RepID=UPI003851A846